MRKVFLLGLTIASAALHILNAYRIAHEPTAWEELKFYREQHYAVSQEYIRLSQDRRLQFPLMTTPANKPTDAVLHYIKEQQRITLLKKCSRIEEMQ